MSCGGAGRTAALVRECELRDEPEVRRIFTEGMMGMIVDTAFRGLPHHPDRLLLYGALTASSLWISASWWMLGLAPLAVLAARYWFSHRVIHRFTEHFLHTDMADIQRSYINKPGSCFWVAEVDGSVAGHVAAVHISRHTVELLRMSVDHRYRGCGVAMALGRRFVEFARSSGYSKAIVGTTNYLPPAHRLYQRLGFHWVGVTNGYHLVPQSGGPSLLESAFYHVSHQHYEMELPPEGSTEH